MKNKVVKYWPVQPTDGNIQYWDGEEWVILTNGLIDQVLVTHGTDSPPAWEYLPLPTSSSSSSSGFIPPPIPSSSSSSSSIFVPPVAASKLILMNDDTVVPDGLVVCDGTKDTPNITNVEIIGAGSSYSVGGTGGSDSVTVPAHSHSSASTHTHPEVNPSMTGTAPSTSASLGNQLATASAKFHSHTLTSKTSGSATMALNSGGSFLSENRPEYLVVTHVIPTSALPTGSFARGATSFYAYWNDTAGTVPSNCLVCDGSGGTPDLRNKMVRSKGAESIGATGGSTTKSFKSHTHNVTHAHVSRVITTGLPIDNNQAVAQYMTGVEVSILSHTHTSINIPASSNNNENLTGNAAQNVPNMPQYYGLTIIELAEDLANWLPAGSVVYCNATSAPSGWKLCDGTNGTLNFSGRFARSTNNPVSVGGTGGEDSTAYPSHSHTGAVHTHSYSGTSWGNTSASTQIDSTPVFYCSAASHVHNGSLSNTSGSSATSYVGNGNPAAADNKPPYHVLQAIKKT